MSGSWRIALGFALLLHTAGGEAALAQTTLEKGKLMVLGRGVVEVSPDFASVPLSVENRAPTPTAALDQNSAAIQKILQFCERMGIPAADIRADAIRVTPRFTAVRDAQGNTRQQNDGYAASNTVTVRVRNLATLGVFLRDVLATGAQSIGNITFGLNDRSKLEDDARALAMEDARRKATGLAAAAQVKLGAVRSITSPPREEIRRNDIGYADLPVRRVPRLQVPLIIGTLEVAAEVDVTWDVSEP